MRRSYGIREITVTAFAVLWSWVWEVPVSSGHL